MTSSTSDYYLFLAGKSTFFGLHKNFANLSFPNICFTSNQLNEHISLIFNKSFEKMMLNLFPILSKLKLLFFTFGITEQPRSSPQRKII